MREIKFKFVEVNDARIVAPKFMDAEFCRSVMNGDGLSEGWAILQFTGLKDKNGKEIYEGDVVRHDSGRNIEIHYSSLQPKFIIMPTTDDTNVDISAADMDWELGNNDKFEIIGNVYENPELLK